MNINPMDMLKNVQGIAQMVGQMKDGLKDISETGQAGGGMVKVTMSGELEMTSIEIDPIAVDPRDLSMLQDLIIAAYHDAHIKMQVALQGRLSPLMSGMNLGQ